MTIKNLKKLEDYLSSEQLEKLDAGAALHKRHAAIEFKIIAAVNATLTVQVIQGKNQSGAYSDQKTLIERGKELFAPFLPDWKINVHATPYTESEIHNMVTTSWVSNEMAKRDIKIKDMVVDTGLDKTNLSAWISGKRPMSNIVKAMFYFYFLSKK